jgi:energy-coupling factor transport system permease protein
MIVFQNVWAGEQGNLLRERSFSVAEGSFTVIDEPESASRETLAWLCNAVRLPEAGDVVVAGKNSRDKECRDAIRRDAVVITGDPDDQIIAATVEEDVAFAPGNLLLPSIEIEERVNEALRGTGLEADRAAMTQELSTLQKMKLVLAGVLALQPKILVAESVTKRLTSAEGEEFRELVDSLRAERGFTVLWLTGAPPCPAAESEGQPPLQLIGQYIAGNSCLHKLDPRCKIAATLIYMLVLLLTTSVLRVGVLFLLSLCLLAVVGVSPLKALRGMRAFIGLLTCMTLFCTFLVPGEVLFTLGVLSASVDGLRAGAVWGLRLLAMVSGTSLLMYTTAPLRLMDGLSGLLSPLRKLGLSVQDFALMMVLALRFLPIMTEEAQRLYRVESKGKWSLRALGVLLSPLFLSAWERAEHLGLAITGRGYGLYPERTMLRPLSWQRRDSLAMASTVLGAFALLII